MRVPLVEELQLLERFRSPILPGELIREHEADVVLVGTEIRELLQRPERLRGLAGLLHPVGVLEEVRLGVALEAFVRADFSELVVDRRAARRAAQDLVAERDRVVVEARFDVMVDGLLVVAHGVGDTALLEVDIADPIEQGDVHFQVGPFIAIEDLDVDRQRLVELLFQLELGCLSSQLRDIRHRRGAGSAKGVPGLAREGGSAGKS